ncbi:MAG TPA: hypothetical protein VF245_09655 [Solirubrobacterales bacterium]
MEAMVQEWTDGRLDDLSEKVDRGFEEVDRRFEQVDKRFEQVDKRLERIEGDIHGLRSEVRAQQLAMTQHFMRLVTVMAGGFVGLATLIVATQVS